MFLIFIQENMYTIQDIYTEYGEDLGLELVVGQASLKRRIKVPEAHRPGLSLAGYLKNYKSSRILIFGRLEMEYLRDFDSQTRAERLEPLVSKGQTPAVIVTRRYNPPKELHSLCERKKIPLFRSTLTTMDLLKRLTLLLNSEFAPCMSCHGTLVEVFGVGVLIQGDSSVGKSEAALGLIERGHRLISDDVVKIRMRENGHLEGFGVDLTRHHMEIRGIGIINVAHLYGAVCVRENKRIDMVVRIEDWDDNHFYDRVGNEERFCEILDIKVPMHILPVKPGRDVVLLLETLALNQRLKVMGYNSAHEFKRKVLKITSGKFLRKKKIESSKETPLNNEKGMICETN